MTKTELIDRMVAHDDIPSKAQAQRVVDAVLDHVTGALKRGEDVTLRGFGVFKVKARAARTGRNPRTGVPVSIKAARVVKFKASPVLL